MSFTDNIAYYVAVNWSLRFILRMVRLNFIIMCIWARDGSSDTTITVLGIILIIYLQKKIFVSDIVAIWNQTIKSWFVMRQIYLLMKFTWWSACVHCLSFILDILIDNIFIFKRACVLKLQFNMQYSNLVWCYCLTLIMRCFLSMNLFPLVEYNKCQSKHRANCWIMLTKIMYI